MGNGDKRHSSAESGVSSDIRQPDVIYRFIRTMRGWCGWKQNASLLPVWRHSEHCIKDANFWRT